MEKNKKIAVVFAAVLLVAAMSACSTHSSKSYTFKVETGDKIKIEMDTSGDYSFAQEEGRFRVEKGEDEILQGMFMTKEGYDQYQTLKDSKEVKILADGEKDGKTYFFQEYEGEAGTETNFVLWIKDSSTGMLIGSLAGEKEAKAAFERLTITLE